MDIFFLLILKIINITYYQEVLFCYLFEKIDGKKTSISSSILDGSERYHIFLLHLWEKNEKKVSKKGFSRSRFLLFLVYVLKRKIALM